MKFMVIDVESIGLYGDAFAVAWVVVDSRSGETLEEVGLACDRNMCSGDPADREWVRQNVPPLEITNGSWRDMLHSFWRAWRKWAEQGVAMVVDCGYPVETNFLSDVVVSDRENRKWLAPYPLYDLASILLAAGVDPREAFDRRENELPRHDPLADARQSARILLEVLGRLEGVRG